MDYNFRQNYCLEEAQHITLNLKAMINIVIINNNFAMYFVIIMI